MSDGVIDAGKPRSVETHDPLGVIAPELFRSMGVDGVYARTALYEDVIERLVALITRHRPSVAEVFRFPPVMSRAQLETAGYLKSFPNLLGCVCALHGTEAEIRSAAARHERGGQWTDGLSPADLVLTPAACYPVYPIAARRGSVPAGGLTFDVAADCFRHEPSQHLDRLQSFRMREYVRIGRPEDVAAFREEWMDRASGIADALALPHRIDQASDPFFGRTGQLMALNQIEQSLKFELLVPVLSEDKPTACMSFNNHREHFGETWGLHHHDGSLCHTGCVAFGMDRLAVALFVTHGIRPQDWPAGVRAALMM